MNSLFSIILFTIFAISFPAFTMELDKENIENLGTNYKSEGWSGSNSFDILASDEGDCSSLYSSDTDSMSHYLPHLGSNGSTTANYLEQYYYRVGNNQNLNYDDYLKEAMWIELRGSPPPTLEDFEWRLANDSTFLYLMNISLVKSAFTNPNEYYNYINYDEFLFYYHHLNMGYVHNFLDPFTFNKYINTTTKEFPLIVEINKLSFEITKNEIKNYQDYISFLISKTQESKSKRRTTHFDAPTLHLRTMMKDINDEAAEYTEKENKSCENRIS